MQNNIEQNNIEQNNTAPNNNGWVNVPGRSCFGFFRNIRAIAIPQLVGEIALIHGDLDTAELQLKQAKAKYKRQYLYISGTVAFTVAVMQLIKNSVDLTDEELGSSISFNTWMNFGTVLIPIIGTVLTGFVHAWDITAGDHLREIEESRRALPPV